MIRRARFGATLGGRALVALLCGTGAACGACGKSPSGGPPTSAAGNGSATVSASRSSMPPDAGPSAVRDVAMWANAREGSTEDLMALATHEGAIGLVEGAAEADLRPTAIRAMGYARGWAQVAFLAGVASASDEELARLSFEALGELAARPRRSEDVEDPSELREGCDTLVTLARETGRARERRIGAIRVLRMMPCPKQELPSDLDAR